MAARLNKYDYGRVPMGLVVVAGLLGLWGWKAFGGGLAWLAGLGLIVVIPVGCLWPESRGVRYHALVFALLCSLLSFVSAPSDYVIVGVLGGFALMSLGVVWLVRVRGLMVARRRDSVAPSPRWLLLAPTIVVVCGLLVAANLPFKVRWGLSRTAFTQRALAGPPTYGFTAPGSESIGLYTVDEQFRKGRAVVFFTDDAGSLSAGLAYVPEGSSLELAGATLSPLGDDWYTVSGAWPMGYAA